MGRSGRAVGARPLDAELVAGAEADEVSADDVLQTVQVTAVGGQRHGETAGLRRHLGPPVPEPRQVVAIGLNYRGHAAEIGMPVPDSTIARNIASVR